MNVFHRRQYGFTFIELMMTLALLGVLALITVPMAQVAAQRGKERELRIALTQIRDAIDAYKKAVDQGRIAQKVGDLGYPKRLEDLVEGVADQKTPTKQSIYFLRRLPRDPFAPDTQTEAADTWGKRAYASPPDDPMEGDDVFDVYSRSELLGLNAVPLKQW
ncbi:MAG TPA: type II secretion system protein [Rhodocyclaceae bacterium]